MYNWAETSSYYYWAENSQCERLREGKVKQCATPINIKEIPPNNHPVVRKLLRRNFTEVRGCVRVKSGSAQLYHHYIIRRKEILYITIPYNHTTISRRYYIPQPSCH